MRRNARETVFKLLFEFSFQGSINDTTKELMLMDSSFDDDDKQFIDKVYRGVISSIDSIKETLKANVTGYELDRIYRSDLVVLEIAAFELSIKEEPVAVVINEAVSLAKKYGTDKSGSFVNGVLAKIAKTL